ncbi:hypothetical protein AAY473_020117 [Plecturocebus cupreus]
MTISPVRPILDLLLHDFHQPDRTRRPWMVGCWWGLPHVIADPMPPSLSPASSRPVLFAKARHGSKLPSPGLDATEKRRGLDESVLQCAITRTRKEMETPALALGSSLLLQPGMCCRLPERTRVVPTSGSVSVSLGLTAQSPPQAHTEDRLTGQEERAPRFSWPTSPRGLLKARLLCPAGSFPPTAAHGAAGGACSLCQHRAPPAPALRLCHGQKEPLGLAELPSPPYPARPLCSPELAWPEMPRTKAGGPSPLPLPSSSGPKATAPRRSPGTSSTAC